MSVKSTTDVPNDVPKHFPLPEELVEGERKETAAEIAAEAAAAKIAKRPNIFSRFGSAVAGSTASTILWLTDKSVTYNVPGSTAVLSKFTQSILAPPEEAELDQQRLAFQQMGISFICEYVDRLVVILVSEFLDQNPNYEDIIDKNFDALHRCTRTLLYAGLRNFCIALGESEGIVERKSSGDSQETEVVFKRTITITDLISYISKILSQNYDAELFAKIKIEFEHQLRNSKKDKQQPLTVKELEGIHRQTTVKIVEHLITPLIKIAFPKEKDHLPIKTAALRKFLWSFISGKITQYSIRTYDLLTDPFSIATDAKKKSLDLSPQGKFLLHFAKTLSHFITNKILKEQCRKNESPIVRKTTEIACKLLLKGKLEDLHKEFEAHVPKHISLLAGLEPNAPLWTIINQRVYSFLVVCFYNIANHDTSKPTTTPFSDIIDYFHQLFSPLYAEQGLQLKRYREIAKLPQLDDQRMRFVLDMIARPHDDDAKRQYIQNLEGRPNADAEKQAYLAIMQKRVYVDAVFKPITDRLFVDTGLIGDQRLIDLNLVDVTQANLPELLFDFYGTLLVLQDKPIGEGVTMPVLDAYFAPQTGQVDRLQTLDSFYQPLVHRLSELLLDKSLVAMDRAVVGTSAASITEEMGKLSIFQESSKQPKKDEAESKHQQAQMVADPLVELKKFIYERILDFVRLSPQPDHPLRAFVLSHVKNLLITIFQKVQQDPIASLSQVIAIVKKHITPEFVKKIKEECDSLRQRIEEDEKAIGKAKKNECIQVELVKTFQPMIRELIALFGLENEPTLCAFGMNKEDGLIERLLAKLCLTHFLSLSQPFQNEENTSSALCKLLFDPALFAHHKLEAEAFKLAQNGLNIDQAQWNVSGTDLVVKEIYWVIQGFLTPLCAQFTKGLFGNSERGTERLVELIDAELKLELSVEKKKQLLDLIQGGLVEVIDKQLDLHLDAPKKQKLFAILQTQPENIELINTELKLELSAERKKQLLDLIQGGLAEVIDARLGLHLDLVKKQHLIGILQTESESNNKLVEIINTKLDLELNPQGKEILNYLLKTIAGDPNLAPLWQFFERIASSMFARVALNGINKVKRAHPELSAQNPPKHKLNHIFDDLILHVQSIFERFIKEREGRFKGLEVAVADIEAMPNGKKKLEAFHQLFSPLAQSFLEIFGCEGEKERLVQLIDAELRLGLPQEKKQQLLALLKGGYRAGLFESIGKLLELDNSKKQRLHVLLENDWYAPEHPLYDLPISMAQKRKIWEEQLPQLISQFFASNYRFIYPEQEIFQAHDRTAITIQENVHVSLLADVTAQFSQANLPEMMRENSAIAQSMINVFRKLLKEVPPEMLLPELQALLNENVHALGLRDEDHEKLWAFICSRIIEPVTHKVVAGLTDALTGIDQNPKYPDFRMRVLKECLTFTSNHMKIVNEATLGKKKSQPHEISSKEMWDFFRQHANKPLHAALDLKNANGDPLDIHDPANKEAAEALKLKEFYAPLALNLLQIANIKEKDMPVPKELQAQVFKLLQEVIGPQLIKTIYEKVKSPNSYNGMLKTISDQLRDFFHNLSKPPKPNGEDEIKANAEQGVPRIDKTDPTGILVSEIERLQGNQLTEEKKRRVSEVFLENAESIENLIEKIDKEFELRLNSATKTELTRLLEHARLVQQSGALIENLVHRFPWFLQQALQIPEVQDANAKNMGAGLRNLINNFPFEKILKKIFENSIAGLGGGDWDDDGKVFSRKKLVLKDGKFQYEKLEGKQSHYFIPDPLNKDAFEKWQTDEAKKRAEVAESSLHETLNSGLSTVFNKTMDQMGKDLLACVDQIVDCLLKSYAGPVKWLLREFLLLLGQLINLLSYLPSRAYHQGLQKWYLKWQLGHTMDNLKHPITENLFITMLMYVVQEAASVSRRHEGAPGGPLIHHTSPKKRRSPSSQPQQQRQQAGAHESPPRLSSKDPIAV